jgi:DNA modification methylase
VSPQPYYQDDFVTIYHGDCREVDAWRVADVVVSDPPYGVAVRTDYAARGRESIARCNDFVPIQGDDEPFDPALFDLTKPTVLFGGNHYASRLPDSPSWVVWDKLDGLTSTREVGFNDQADAELIWTNLGGPARLMAQRWMGAMKAGVDRSVRRSHPTQKPVELLTRLIGLCPPGVIADPFMGSGTTLRAAKNLGRRAIGVEIEEHYCEIAALRLSQEVLDFGGAA